MVCRLIYCLVVIFLSCGCHVAVVLFSYGCLVFYLCFGAKDLHCLGVCQTFVRGWSGSNLEFSSDYHVVAVRSSCRCQMGLCVVVVVWLSFGFHVVVLWLSCGCCKVVVWLSSGCRVVVVWLLHGCHVVVRLILKWLSGLF